MDESPQQPEAWNQQGFQVEKEEEKHKDSAKHAENSTDLVVIQTLGNQHDKNDNIHGATKIIVVEQRKAVIPF